MNGGQIPDQAAPQHISCCKPSHIGEPDPADAELLKHAAKGIRLRGAGAEKDARGFGREAPRGAGGGGGGVKSEMKTSERGRFCKPQAAEWRRAA